jgi:hypothetical protein
MERENMDLGAVKEQIHTILQGLQINQSMEHSTKMTAVTQFKKNIFMDWPVHKSSLEL